VSCSASVWAARAEAQTCPIESATNCQVFDDAGIGLGSNYSINEVGQHVADDFVPLTDTISSLCVWGSPLPLSPNCAWLPPWGFRVRVFGSDADGLPDSSNIVGQAHVDLRDVVSSRVPDASLETFVYHIPIDPPITGLVADGTTCYWLEVVYTTLAPPGEDCSWYWYGVETSGNGFSAIGTGGTYSVASPHWMDMAFCLSGDFLPGCGVPTAYCCSCEGTCAALSRADCQAGGGQWRIDGACASLSCEPGPPANDLCESVRQADYTPASNGLSLIETMCADTDGVNPVVVGSNGTSRELGADVWVKYVATCDGRLRLSVRDTTDPASVPGFDPYIVAYRDALDPTTCVCPATAAEQDAAVEWYEVPSAGPGQPPWHAAPYVDGYVLRGDCLMLRVGGLRAAGPASDYRRGAGALAIACDGFVCPEVDYFGPFPNRYITIETYACPAFDRRIALRVRYGSPVFEGIRYVGAPKWFGGEFENRPAAPLECEPHFRDWSTSPVISIYGAEIMPWYGYRVEWAPDSCDDLSDESCWRHLAYLGTGWWGDVTAPFKSIDAPVQPDFNDIAAVVRQFVGASGAPGQRFAQLQPNLVFPDRPVDFKDIAASVVAFTGTPFSEMAGITGPCACPSSVVCGAAACIGDPQCLGGYCIDGFCTDACGRCTP